MRACLSAEANPGTVSLSRAFNDATLATGVEECAMSSWRMIRMFYDNRGL